MTIRERIEIAIPRCRQPENTIISVFDNTTEWSPNNFWFYLCDYKDFKDSKQLDFELDNEHIGRQGGDKVLSLGFDGLHKHGRGKV